MKIVAKPIEVVSWTDKQGIIHPIRFRNCTDEEGNVVVKIDRIITRELEKYAGNSMLVYKCQSVIDGMERVYELKYELISCKWILFKI